MTNVLMGTLKPTHSLTYYIPNTLFQLNEFLVPTTAEKNYTVNNDSALSVLSFSLGIFECVCCAVN